MINFQPFLILSFIYFLVNFMLKLIPTGSCNVRMLNSFNIKEAYIFARRESSQNILYLLGEKRRELFCIHYYLWFNKARLKHIKHRTLSSLYYYYTHTTRGLEMMVSSFLPTQIWPPHNNSTLFWNSQTKPPPPANGLVSGTFY